MDKYQIYENFVDLLSPDEEKRYEALLAKREWILDKFYIPYSFAIDKDTNTRRELNALAHFNLVFKKLPIRTIETKESLYSVKKFNEKYLRLKMYYNLPIRYHKDTIFVEVDFRKLDKDDYKALVACLFPCIPLSTFKEEFTLNDIRTTFKYACEGNDNSLVLLMDKTKLDNGLFKIDGFTKLYIYDDIDESMRKALLKLAHRLRLKVVEVHGY